MHTTILRIFGILVVPALLTSCATTSLVDTWRNPGIAIQKHHKLLAVYVSKNESVQRVYEDVLVNELQKKGVMAEPGHMFIPGGKSVTREALDKGIKESGVDGVITMQLIRIEHHTVVESRDIYPYYWYPTLFPRWDMYGYFNAYPFYEPPDIHTYEIGKIQVNFFDAPSGKLEWAGTVETSKPGDVVTVAKEMGNIIIQKLMEEGLI